MELAGNRKSGIEFVQGIFKVGNIAPAYGTKIIYLIALWFNFQVG